MRRILLVIFGLGAVLAFAIATVFPMPERAEGLYVPTIYVPGGSCQMPIKLDDRRSVKGLRRLENIRVAIAAQTERGPLRMYGLAFDGLRHDDSWGTINVEAHQDAGRPMEHAYLVVTLPESDDWRGVEATLTATADLVYPDETVTPAGTRAYEEKRAPINRQFSFRIATLAEERDVAERRARWDADDRRWNSAFDRWQTTRLVGFGAGGVFTLALLATMVMKRKKRSE